MNLTEICGLILLALGVWRVRSAVDPPSAYAGVAAVGLGAMTAVIGFVLGWL